MMNFLVFIFFIFCTTIQAAPVPTKFRYEFHLGKAWSNYKEIRNSVVLSDRDFNQESYFGEFQTTYWMVPKFLDLNFGLRHLGFGAKTDGASSELYSLQNIWGNAGLHIPIFSDYLWFKLVGEFFYGNMNTEDSFGFSNLTGTTLYPGLEYFPHGTDMFFSASPYIRVPLVSSTNSWKEYTYGLKLKFPVVRGRPKFPLYAYQKAFIIRIVYSRVELAIREEGFLPVDAEHSWTGISLGYEW